MNKTYNEIENLDIREGDRVLLRVDFNVPTSKSGEILNDFRIKEALPTILDLQKMGARIIILAHKESGSLEKIAEYLQEKIEKFEFLKGEITENYKTLDKIEEWENGKVVLLENVRSDKREKDKDVEKRDTFAKELAKYGDYYINEAFSASHRDHSSITSLPKFFQKDKRALGPKFVNEINKLSLALSPKHPFFLIVGGAKFDTKLKMLEKFINISDKIFVGGALAHSFWKEKNYNLGKSLIDNETTLEKNILDAQIEGKIILPVDVILQNNSTLNLPLDNDGYEKNVFSIGAENRIVDFGPKTLENILQMVEKSNTVVWNGPVGYYEGGFEFGTRELILNLDQIQKNSSNKNIILGGGDTVTEIDKLLAEKKLVDPNFNFNFTHISTGGGAMIDFLSNGTLPGIEAIVTNL